MKQTLLAKRYAKALFELALSENLSDKVNTDMELLAAVMNENRELRRVMANPLITPQRKKSLMNELFGSRFNPLSIKFVTILVKKGREQILAEVAGQYQEIFLEHNNIALVDLTTAYPADESLARKISDVAKQNTNKSLRFNLHTDPSIIGGFKLRMGDYLLDDSITKVLAELQKEFDKNLYIKRF
ncbi:ATP synthase F1 subunit delta [Bacteroidales bacterium]